MEGGVSMKVTKAEVLSSKNPVPLPQPWKAAWREPGGEPVTSLDFSMYKVHTDEGITGIGPYTGGEPSLVVGLDPFRVEEFWFCNMSGRRRDNSDKGAAGLEIALWDIIGKAVGQPIYKLLGAYRDRVPVYAATSRLLSKEEHIEHVKGIILDGYKAVKLRMHRPNPWDDLAVIESVCKAVGDDIRILVDTNQNNFTEGYDFWSRKTSFTVARRLQELGVYYVEEPLPRTDIEGLAEMASSLDIFIAGGEHTPTIYDFKQHILKGAYDIIQPDVVIGGNWGITGIRRISLVAEYFSRLIVPHVITGGNMVLALAATLHAMATVENCPLVEFPYDPPILTEATTQYYAKEPLRIDKDGLVRLPDKPGLGIEIDEKKLLG
jgi:L-alanine-DL-glutamate epimerase-like enolase superfamily enzyme